MKNKIFLLLAVIATIVCVTGFSGAEQNKIQSINIQTLKAWMNKSEKIIMIDDNGILACMDTKIPDAACLSCDEEKDTAFFSTVPKESKIVFYTAYQPLDLKCDSIRQTLSAGLKGVYVLDGGLAAWRKAGFSVVSEKRIPRVVAPAVKPEKLAQWQKKVTKPLLIDIRSAKKFAVGHLDGAVNFPLTRLHLQYADIPLDRTLLVVDDDGQVGFLAASYLIRKGFLNVQRLQGGMAAVKRGAK
jgi:rhodanese-related sulfurtransferase